MRKAAFFTLGCKVNQYETAALMQQFSQNGFEIVTPDDVADVYVINSCTVTAQGDKKSRQAIRKMKRQNPNAIVCLCGCFPQAFPDAAQNIPEVDIVMGAKDRLGLISAINERFGTDDKIVRISPHEKDEAFEPLGAGDFHEKTRATLKIEDGCRQYCAYCIIPKARGPVRSKPPEAIIADIKALALAGYKEVVLAGINLSCYGQDIGLRLVDAVTAACGVKGICRVRLSSLEPQLINGEDIKRMSELENLCPHFHLSLQSGCDDTLKRMKRMYTCEEYANIAGNLRKSFKNASITTDIMVGFPGETDSEFAQSLSFCKSMGFARAHVFAYSKRPGTAAVSMPDQVDATLKRTRSRIMASEMRRQSEAFLETQIGLDSKVLFEARNADGVWQGYSENYAPFLYESDGDLNGKILTIKANSVRNAHLILDTD